MFLGSGHSSVCSCVHSSDLCGYSFEAVSCMWSCPLICVVPRQFVYGHFVYDTSSTDISFTDISSTTVYQRTGQLYIQLLFQQIIIFINSNFYLHYGSFLSIPLPLPL